MASPYRRIFSIRGTAAFAAAGFVGRAAHLITVLSVLFLVSRTTGSYGQAGAVAAAYALAYSLASPQLSRLMDRHRQGAVLMVTAVANGLGRAGFLLAVWAHAPAWILVALSAVSGATMPAIGSLVRARWSHLYRGSPLLDTALSFESVVDEVIFVVGPIAVSILATYLNPAAAMVLALMLAVLGQLALAAQRDTEPPVRETGARLGRSALSAPGFVVLLVIFVAVGAAESIIYVATIAFAEQHDDRASSGWILALIGFGSACSGLWYGARQWRSPPERRMLAALVPLAGATLLFVIGWSSWTLALAALPVGLMMAPAVIAGFSAVGRFVPERHLTEGMAWVTTAIGLGISSGSAIGGRVVDAWGTRTAFALAACCAGAAVAVGVVMVRRARGDVRADQPVR